MKKTRFTETQIVNAICNFISAIFYCRFCGLRPSARIVSKILETGMAASDRNKKLNSLQSTAQPSAGQQAG